MKNKILLYRVKEEYSIFYEEDTHNYVKLFHRKQGLIYTFLYMFLFLIMLYLPKYFNSYYQKISSVLVNIILIMVALVLAMLFSKKYLNYYYLFNEDSQQYINKFYVEQKISYGKKQLRIETVVFIVSLAINVFATTIFLLYSNLYFYVICFLCFFLIFIYLNMNPIKRNKILNGDWGN
ncbi:hypothetical protein ACQ3MN_07810 [Enterococcus faecalis]|uniref:hypothetical protein n=1 Tax=Enterococcus faecalis TaxID=1351 RepID=UPI003D782931